MGLVINFCKTNIEEFLFLFFMFVLLILKQFNCYISFHVLRLKQSYDQRWCLGFDKYYDGFLQMYKDDSNFSKVSRLRFVCNKY